MQKNEAKSANLTKEEVKMQSENLSEEYKRLLTEKEKIEDTLGK